MAVVILTWNGLEDTLECLDSLRAEVEGDDAVIVCDNGSQDGTEDAIRAQHPWVDFIQNGANVGFAAGNNPGLRSALERGFRWVLLLNNDTKFPPGALTALLAHAASRQAVGAFQPLTVQAADPERSTPRANSCCAGPGAWTRSWAAPSRRPRARPPRCSAPARQRR